MAKNLQDTHLNAGDLRKLYTPDLQALATKIQFEGRLIDPEVSVRIESRTCGSVLIADFRIENGRVVAFAQEVQACALGRASASIWGKRVFGCTRTDAAVTRDLLRRYLNGEMKELPVGWEDYDVFSNLGEFVVRHASIMLPIEATYLAFENHGKTDGQMVAGRVS